MRENGNQNFSDFLRNRIFQEEKTLRVEEWFSLWQHQKIEQISRDIHRILVIVEATYSVTSDNLKIILSCVQELLLEVEKSVPISQVFKEKYMG